MKFMIKGALWLMPALAFAPSAFALAPATLSDSEQPGSVIVYSKFVGGAIGVAGSVPPVTVDGITGISRTEIEIGAVCPTGATPGVGLCAKHAPVFVNFHWVCPGTEGVNSNICKENSFQVALSIDGKLAFSADGTPINTNSPRVLPPPCPRGYLIGWVVNSAGAPIKFDALVGNGVLRGPNIAGESTAVSAYAAITIQANPVDAVGATLSLPLDFDGLSGGYSEITGVQIADVKFDRMVSAPPPAVPQPNVLSVTTLNLLTLDVMSGRPNNPTFVPYLFFNESDAAPSGTNPLFENPTDGTLSFVCWAQLLLSTDIDASLTQVFQGTRKGLVIAGPATKVEDGHAPGDEIGPVTLLGLVETVEGTAANNFQERRYNYVPSNNGVPVPTTFVP